MQNKTICKIMVVSIAFVIFTSSIINGANTGVSDSEISLSSSTINVPGDFKKIQLAIDNANAGDTIIVNSGTYQECIWVNKQLTLKGIGMPVVDAGGRSYCAISISADEVTLEGFKAINSLDGGIYVDSHNNSITGNAASNNGVIGMEFRNSNRNTITYNIASNNGYKGIDFSNSCNNNITGNIANSNGGDGINLLNSNINNITYNTANDNDRSGTRFSASSNNNIIGNNASNNKEDSIDFSNSSKNIITSNIASSNGGNGIYFRNSSNNIITGNDGSNNKEVGIDFWISSNNIIENNNAKNNEDDGINIVYSHNNTITNNNAANNKNTGIELPWGGINGITGYNNNHTITGNIVTNNVNYGIYIAGSNNIIADNNITNNSGGIGIRKSSNTITGNIFTNNELFSIIIRDSNNIITNNHIFNNEDGAIHFGSSSDHNIITDNIITNNENGGINLWNSSNNIIDNNIVSNNNISNFSITSNSDGSIHLWNSSNNKITNNKISNNNRPGIRLDNSSNNTIYNNYFNNTKNAYDNGNNIWNITKTPGTNIVGGPYLGGNYWNDYNGTDLDGDKLGDTLLPYNSFGDIQHGGDYHPLIEIKIRGYKFNDTNGDGVWDRINESALANWTIRLEGTAEDGSTILLITTTDANGYYRFEDVPKGTYILSEVLADGWIQTWPHAPGTYRVHVTNGGMKNKDFGNRMFWVSGYKFNDTNDDGVWYLVNESALINWTIRLEGTTDDGSTISLITTTDANGYYRFEDVPRGTYTISEVLADGWIQTWPHAPGTYTVNVTDSDIKNKNFGNRRFLYNENIIVGAPGEDAGGNKDQGRVYIFYGLTGELRHTIDCPSQQPDASFGYSVSAGMVGSDYRDEIIVGAPGEGHIYTFYGATSKLHHTIACPSSQLNSLFGYSVSTGDVNSDGFDEIIVGAPGEGRVYTFYALTGELHHTIECPNLQPDALFGRTVNVGDVNGDGFNEIIVGAPGEDVGGNESQGRVYTFYGATSKLRHILECPNPQPDASFGYSVIAGDLVSDYREEVIVGAPGEDVGNNENQGRVYTYNGATNELHIPLNCPVSRSYVDFGHSVGIGDMNGDGLNEVVVGAPGEGRIYTFYGLTGKVHHTIDCPNPQPDALFGYSLCAGMVGSDYRDEIIVGTPGEDVGGNENQGRVYTFYGATSKQHHTLDTSNPQPDADFGWSVSVFRCI